jgi:hypothetical protein
VSSEWDRFLDQKVVVDTTTHMLYLGLLVSVGDEFIEIACADVHDSSESSSTKEKYTMETGRHGIRMNRENVFVRKAFVISVSLLSDVVDY